MKIINSFKYAFKGILTTFEEEKNLKIEIFISILVILSGIVFKISLSDWKTIFILFGIIFSSEIFNTSIENLSNKVCKEKNEEIKKVKDMSAGAVLINAFFASIVGLIIFLPKIINIIK